MFWDTVLVFFSVHSLAYQPVWAWASSSEANDQSPCSFPSLRSSCCRHLSPHQLGGWDQRIRNPLCALTPAICLSVPPFLQLCQIFQRFLPYYVKLLRKRARLYAFLWSPLWTAFSGLLLCVCSVQDIRTVLQLKYDCANYLYCPWTLLALFTLTSTCEVGHLNWIVCLLFMQEFV